MEFDTPMPCAEVPVHPRSGRLWANVRPIGAQTDVPSYPMDALYDQAALDAAVDAERERCAKLRRLLLSCKRAMQASQKRPGYAVDWTHVVAAIDAATTRETASTITPPAAKG